jgi:hypothetical protein
MAPLGLQITTIGSLGGDFLSMGGRATVISDYFWEAKVSCELTPIPVTLDFNDMWDLDGSDYMPQASPVNEGWWEIDSNSDFQPIAIACS